MGDTARGRLSRGQRPAVTCGGSVLGGLTPAVSSSRSAQPTREHQSVPGHAQRQRTPAACVRTRSPVNRRDRGVDRLPDRSIERSDLEVPPLSWRLSILV